MKSNKSIWIVIGIILILIQGAVGVFGGLMLGLSLEDDLYGFSFFHEGYSLLYLLLVVFAVVVSITLICNFMILLVRTCVINIRVIIGIFLSFCVLYVGFTFYTMSCLKFQLPVVEQTRFLSAFKEYVLPTSFIYTVVSTMFLVLFIWLRKMIERG